jgi:hypothetical protein
MSDRSQKRFVLAVAILAASACKSSHKIVVRVEGANTCTPDISIKTLANGSADVRQFDAVGLPWQKELDPELEELTLDVYNHEPACTQVQCQVIDNDKTANVRLDAAHAICKWNR